MLIVAAYAAVRAGLHALLADAPECRVLGEVSGSAELESLLPGSGASVLLADDSESDGVRILELAENQDVGIVLLTDDADRVRRLVERPPPGWACLAKEADGPEIVSALRAVALGLVVLGPGLAARLAMPPPRAAVGRPNHSPAAGEGLTAREREVLQLMAEGLPNKTIASRLGITAHTVKFHVAAILAKLGAASRTEAVTLGARRGDVLL